MFDMAAWGAADAAAKGRDLDATLAEIATHAGVYAALVSMVLSGCAAYRMQLFCYLKSCSREELGTMNLWAGMDAPTA